MKKLLIIFLSIVLMQCKKEEQKQQPAPVIHNYQFKISSNGTPKKIKYTTSGYSPTETIIAYYGSSEYSYGPVDFDEDNHRLYTIYAVNLKQPPYVPDNISVQILIDGIVKAQRTAMDSSYTSIYY
jgi:hypothetical protein